MTYKMSDLQWRDIEQHEQFILSDDAKTIISLIIGYSNHYQFQKLQNETLCRQKTVALIEVQELFERMEKFDFANYIKKTIELKTLLSYRKLINI